MPMDHLEALLKLRARLLETVVYTTGVMTLAATANGFTRADAGSFIVDGFKRWFELLPSGFTDNDPLVINAITAGAIVGTKPRTAEAAAPGRSLTVGIPAIRSWENKRQETEAGFWYIDEDYIPGVPFRDFLARADLVMNNPQYILKLGGLSGSGVTSLYTVAQAILAQFPSRFAFAMVDGYSMTVSTSPAPSRSQLLPLEGGRAEIVITIPLEKRSAI